MRVLGPGRMTYSALASENGVEKLKHNRRCFAQYVVLLGVWVVGGVRRGVCVCGCVGVCVCVCVCVCVFLSLDDGNSFHRA